MTHRLDIHQQDRSVVLEFQGLLDAGALAELRASVALARENGAGARIVLRAGTEVERCCLPALRDIDAEVVAEAAYLASWLHDSR
ncbi:MAG TPA: hypothetical protein VIV57_17345 [Anaeromyxobacter sp.]